MKGKLPRSSVGIIAACLVATLGASAPGGAVPLVKYKCTGTINYRGHPFEFYTTTLWSWTFDSHGTCVAGLLQKVTYDTSGFTMPGCGGPVYATSSRRQPTSTYLGHTAITNKRGETATFAQQWVGTDTLQINAWEPVPSRYIPIGGIVGLGTSQYGRPTGTWEETTLTGKVVFAFSAEEIPNTDQPDGEAC